MARQKQQIEIKGKKYAVDAYAKKNGYTTNAAIKYTKNATYSKTENGVLYLMYAVFDNRLSTLKIK